MANTLFGEMTDSYFLYFSWLELKRFTTSLGFKDLNRNPISLRWFYKTSYLLRKGIYKYSYVKLVHISKTSKFSISQPVCLYNRIVENAIFNVIFPLIQVKAVVVRSLILHQVCFG